MPAEETEEDPPDRPRWLGVTVGLRGVLGPSLELEVAPSRYFGVYLEGTAGARMLLGRRLEGRAELGVRLHPQGRGVGGFFLAAFLVVADYENLLGRVQQLPAGGAALGWAHTFGAFSLAWQLGVSSAEVTTTSLRFGVSGSGYFPYPTIEARSSTERAAVVETRVAIGFNL